MSAFIYCCTYSWYISEKNEELIKVAVGLEQELVQSLERFKENTNFLHSLKSPGKQSKIVGDNVANIPGDNNTKHRLIIENLKKIVGDSGVVFMLSDNQGRILFKSDALNQALTEDSFRQAPVNTLRGEKGFFSDPLHFGAIDFSYYRKLKGDPSIVIFTGFDKQLLERALHKQIIPMLCALLLMGLGCTVILYFFRQKIIAPISMLSDCALCISKGEMSTKIPKQNSIEMFNLAKALMLVKHYIKRNETYRRKLEAASEIIKTSSQAREDFLKSIQQTLMQPLKEILICTEILSKTAHGQPMSEDIQDIAIKCTEKIREAALNIKTKTSGSLTLSYCCVNEVITQVIKIALPGSLTKKVRLVANLSEDLPPMYGDVLKLKQILLSLISQSIENSPENQEVLIFSSVIASEQNTNLKITIQDFGFGLSEEELNTIQKNVGWVDEHNLFTTLDLPFIEKLIKMHHGHLHIENKIYTGRTVELIFPLLTEENYSIEKNDSNVYYLQIKK